MKLSNLFEARYAVHVNQMRRGMFYVKMPNLQGPQGQIQEIVLQNAVPQFIPTGVTKHIVVGDFVSGEGYHDEGLGELEVSGSAQLSGPGREILFDPAKLKTPDAFYYADTKEVYRGSKYARFVGRSFFAYD